MTQFYERVLEVIRKDNRFFSQNGVLLKNALYEVTMQMDPKPIKQLYSN